MGLLQRCPIAPLVHTIHAFRLPKLRRIAMSAPASVVRTTGRLALPSSPQDFSTGGLGTSIDGYTLLGCTTGFSTSLDGRFLLSSAAARTHREGLPTELVNSSGVDFIGCSPGRDDVLRLSPVMIQLSTSGSTRFCIFAIDIATDSNPALA